MTDNIRERRFAVDQNFDGWRLDHFLASRLGRISRSRAGEIAKHGDVRVEPHRKVKAGTKLHVGDVVVLREHLPPETVQYDDVGVLYQDDAIIVLDKPAGMLVHESPTVRLNTVTMFLKTRGYENAEPAHRIDRETSGLLLCSASPQWIAPLRAMFATTHPEKVYRALVMDPDVVWPPGRTATLTTPLKLDVESALGLRMIPGDLSATTHVTTLDRRSDIADVEVRIETGRQHQIRVHLAMEGTPVAGDKLYTYDDAFFMEIHDAPDDVELLDQLPYPRHMLHAWRLAFSHPDTGVDCEFEAPLPTNWGLPTIC